MYLRSVSCRDAMERVNRSHADATGSGTGLVSIALALYLSERHAEDKTASVTATDLGESARPIVAVACGVVQECRSGRKGRAGT
jgi:methylase of polypeptide subunit release factors